MMEAAAAAVGACCHDSDWRVVAASIESTHMHLQLTFTPRDIGNTAKWISDQCTKAIRRRAGFEAKVWAKGRWLQYIFDADHWDRLLAYIERHNMRRGLPAKPYPWIR
jgi:REP element-mobilizing transposase RayT